MIIQFNWAEISGVSKVPENQLILALCMFINYLRPHDRKIAKSIDDLANKLKIDSVSSSLISKKLILNNYNGVISNYICAEPQNYTTNISFMYADVHVKHKTNYLYMLGQRTLNSKNRWIPDYYAEPKQYNTNPFITHTDNKIFFKLEKQL